MIILYHHRTLADGAEGIHIAEMVKAFRDLGHTVHVTSLVSSNGSPRSAGVVPRLKAGLPSAAFELASAGSNVVDYWHVRQAIRSVRPAFLYKRHARFDNGALRAARNAAIPAVLEVNCLYAGEQYHQFEPMRLPRLAARFERRALELSTVVTAVSTPLARHITSMAHVDPVVVPNGVDPERFNPKRADARRVRERFRLGMGVIIGWAGVIREWHGLELLLDAMATMPAVQLLIVGDGPARQAVADRAAALGLGERVVITGRIPHDEMPDHIAAMDIAVVASDGTGVASPMKLTEYMAMSRAAVAPRLENITDVVTDAVDGLLFTPGDSTSLAGAVRRLVSDAPLRTQLGQAARVTIERSRTWRRNAELVLALVSARHVTTAHGRKEQHV